MAKEVSTVEKEQKKQQKRFTIVYIIGLVAFIIMMIILEGNIFNNKELHLNAKLLKLKTEIWEGGLEDVFRSMLTLGTNLAEGITSIAKHFGALPVAIGAVTLAFTMLSKNMRLANNVMVTGVDGTQKVVRQYNDWILKIQKVIAEIKKQNTYVQLSNKGTQKISVNITGVAKVLGKMAGQAALATAKTIMLEAATIALNAALSMGLSFAITAIVSAIDELVHAEEKAIEKNNELIAASKDNAQTISNEIISIQELRKEYEELSKKEKRTDEENQKIYEIQEQLNQLIKETGTQVELVTTKVTEQGQEVQVINDKYDEQLAKIKAIEYEKKRQETEELRKAADAAIANQMGIKLSNGFDFW